VVTPMQTVLVCQFGFSNPYLPPQDHPSHLPEHLIPRQLG
jgi:hypothetical protein